MNDLLITSALSEACWSVLLSWGLSMIRSNKVKATQHTNSRLMQAHLDYLFMAALQLGVAACVADIPPWVAWPLIVGSWTNPSVFLLQLAFPSLTSAHPITAVIAVPSCLMVTIGWFTLLYLWLNRKGYIAGH